MPAVSPARTHHFPGTTRRGSAARRSSPWGRIASAALLLALGGAAVSCDDDPAGPEIPAPGPYSFTAPVFDIDASPDGGRIVVAETVFPTAPGATTLMEITSAGVAEFATIPAMVEGTPINGLLVEDDGDLVAARGGLDLAVGAGVLRVSGGTSSLMGDIEAFETASDPDATAGPGWKTPACEFNPDQGFSAGPQSNPYHMARVSANTVLVADAAGNTLLSVSSDGTVTLEAVFTPPTDAEGDWMVLFPLDEDTDCYVQPVPSAVAVGPDGDYYVGELIGTTPGNLGGQPSPGLARVWRIDPDSDPAVCPSAGCVQVASGLTSIIDMEFDAQGQLYVVEYDENDWFAATVLGNPAGGTVNRCATSTGQCTAVIQNLTLPGAITFDDAGNAWLLEDNIGSPVVRKVDLP